MLEAKQSHDEELKHLPAKVMLLQSHLQDQACQVQALLQCNAMSMSKRLVMTPFIQSDHVRGISSNVPQPTHDPIVSQLLSDVASLQRTVQQLTGTANESHHEVAIIQGGLYILLCSLATI